MNIDKLRKALSDAASALGLNEKLLARAQRRYQANRKRAYKANKQQKAAQATADKLRAQANKYLSYDEDQNVAKGEALLRKALRKDKKAARLSVVATNNHKRAQNRLAAIKMLQARIEGLDKRQAEVQAELKKLDHVEITGNVAKGGTPGERFKAVCLKSVENCANGTRRNFYSMSGSWDVDHVIVPGEQYGERSDCSSTVTGWAKAAGLPDPNGEDWHGGYTGTLISGSNGWTEVSRARMVEQGWGYVIYGSGVGHHVEAYIGPGDRTAGHGSSPVDFGVIDLFGSGEVQRYFIYAG